MEPSVSRYGAMCAMAALFTVTASTYLVFTGAGCTPLLLLVFYGAGASEIIILCRTAVPSWMQTTLIFSIIASLTTLTARTDVFGVQQAVSALPEAGVADTLPSNGRAATAMTGARPRASAHGSADVDASNVTRAEGGAKVIFQPTTGGDEGWARRLNDAYDRHFGGPQASALMISGFVGAKRIGKDMNVEVNWGVSTGGTSVRCGSTSAYGSDDPALSDQISQGLGQAIARSLELRRPSCQ